LVARLLVLVPLALVVVRLRTVPLVLVLLRAVEARLDEPLLELRDVLLFFRSATYCLLVEILSI
jgi:hypothetical protein